jgi:hypothetical protein
MGVEGYGASIIAKGKSIRCFEKEIVFAKPRDAKSSDWWEEFVEFAAEQRFLLLHGVFSTYVVDVENCSISLFKDTIRAPEGIWCEETPIFGSDTCHVSGTRRHYYLQFPFLSEADFVAQRSIYHELRRQQIKEAKDKQLP